MNRPVRFAVIGSGWRAMYYLRIAAALPHLFEVSGVLCRKAEKAERIHQEFGVPAMFSAEEICSGSPEFAVIAVDKAHINEVGAEWLERGIPALCETPAAMDRNALKQLRAIIRTGRTPVYAEQYLRYPEHIARIAILNSGLIGAPHFLNLSAAHGYHGASLMRAFLQLPSDISFTVKACEWRFPTAETLTRYEQITDGRVADKTRTAAFFTFENGKAAVYEFDSEQYRSPIRGNICKIQGERGEILNTSVRWLNQDNLPEAEEITAETRTVITQDINPNFHSYEEITGITLGRRQLYVPPYGQCGLSQDETAIASLLEGMGAYVRKEADAPYSLQDALSDSLMAIALQEAVSTGREIHSEELYQYWENM